MRNKGPVDTESELLAPPRAETDLEMTNRSLMRHVRALSHDLGGPIATTMSALRLLAQFGDMMTEIDRREVLDRSISRLGDLVFHMDSVLDEATIDHGAHLAPTDITLAMQWALSTLSQPDEERLTIVMQDTELVLARRVALRQVLQNVVSNTLRHNAGTGDDLTER